MQFWVKLDLMDHGRSMQAFLGVFYVLSFSFSMYYQS